MPPTTRSKSSKHSAPSVQIEPQDVATPTETFMQLLSSGKPREAIDIISIENYADISDTFIDWVNSPITVRGNDSLREFILALSRRAGREATFVDTAVRVLQDMFTRILPMTIDNDVYLYSWTGKQKLLSIIEYMAKDTLLVILTRKITTDRYQTATHDRISYVFETLSDEKLTTRCCNAELFIAQLMRAELLARSYVCQWLAPAIAQTWAVCRCLLVLGPFFDVDKRSSELDDLISQHKAAQVARANGRKVQDDALEKLEERRNREWQEEENRSVPAI